MVGSWQAGDPADGLAHYARRFDDLLTEVELLDTRLSTGGGDPKHTLSSARQLRPGSPRPRSSATSSRLGVRLDALIERAGQAVAEAKASREAQRGAAVARKEALAAEAERLAAESTQWKQAGERFKEILEEWRTVRGVDRKTDEALWRRFSRARDGFNRRRGAHFAELDRQRAGARSRKEELVSQAEELADSSDWGATAARYRELMAEWKAAGRAHKDADDALWQRFRAAQDAFFGRRSAAFTERDAEFTSNATAKQALLVEAEKIDLSDPDGARARLRAIQQRWEAIGKVPRQQVREFEDRMRAAEQRVKDAADAQWRRADPEAQARVDQFRVRVEQYEAQAAKAHAAGTRAAPRRPRIRPGSGGSGWPPRSRPSAAASRFGPASADPPSAAGPGQPRPSTRSTRRSPARPAPARSPARESRRSAGPRSPTPRRRWRTRSPTRTPMPVPTAG